MQILDARRIPATIDWDLDDSRNMDSAAALIAAMVEQARRDGMSFLRFGCAADTLVFTMADALQTGPRNPGK